MKRLLALPVLVLLAGAASSCGPSPAPTAVPTPGQMTTLVLTSSAFAAGGPIPEKYTCQGEDVSPPLQWSDPPSGTRSFALVMDDPDAGNFRHWMLYNLPADARSLPEAVLSAAELASGGRQGQNSWGKLEYGGPCPPGGTHRYSFRLYALDTTLNLPAGAKVEQLEQAMQGHVLAQVELVGLYSKK